MLRIGHPDGGLAHRPSGKRCWKSAIRSGLSGLGRRISAVRPGEAWGGKSVADIISPQVLSDLIGSIYDCALDPSRWDRTLLDIKNAFNSHNVALSLSDVRHDRLLLVKNVGLEPRDHELYSIHAAEIHDLLLRCLARPLDEAHVASRVLPQGYMDASPYFQAAR